MPQKIKKTFSIIGGGRGGVRPKMENSIIFYFF